MNDFSIQAIINEICNLPRVGVPDIIAEVHGERVKSIRLMLVFRSGQTYCCMEPGCHLGLDTDRCRMIIERARSGGIVISKQTVIRILGIVQSGVMLSVPPGYVQDKPYEFISEHACSVE